MYDYKNSKFENYLSDKEHSLTRFINGDYRQIFANKVIFEEVFSDTIKIPNTYGIILDGQMYSDEGSKKNKLIEYIFEKKQIVLKPINDSGGNGVYLIKVRKNNVYINNKQSSINKLKQTLLNIDGYFMSEFIEQGEFGENLYSGSINTIRIVVGRDPLNKKGFIIGAAQRIGGNSTNGLDNFSMGGYSADIDIETGKLGKVVASLKNNKEDKKDKYKLEKYSYHPETQINIEGEKVPLWNEIKDSVLRIMEKKPYINYMGADILIDKKGDIVCIEINNHPQVGVLQVHKGLLENEKNMNFYKYYGIIN